jgi:hypothetical protein
MPHSTILHLYHGRSISFHYSTYFSSIFSLSFHNFLLYFLNHFTIQLIFLPYFQENCEMIGKIWKKSKLNSEKIWKMQKKSRLNCEMIWKIWKKSQLNSEKIWKIQKKNKYIFHIISEFNLFFFCIFHILSLLNLLFFCIFKKSFHYFSDLFTIFTYFSSTFSIS